MAKRNVPPPDTWLADFRESAGLAPPPRTLSNAASRLVDLLDEFLYSLQCGWEIPPGFPHDRFVPTVYGKRDLVAPIVQYLIDLGFTGDARLLHEATRRFYAHRDWKLMTPSPGDDKGWKEFQKRYVNPLVHLAGCLQGRICDVRQLIIDMGSKGSVDPMAGGEESGSNTTAEKAKRSTEPGEGRAKLISALTKHHKYADGSCLNLESVGNNELGRLADVSKASASDFFTLEFGGHTKYKNGYCTDASRLAAVLKQLNGEYSADMLFGGTPPSEKEPDDED